MAKTLRGKDLIEAEDRLLSYDGADRIVSSRDIADELALTEESAFKLNTGVPSLDRILNGVEAGEVVIVTGPTGEGKTTLLMTITKNMVEEKVPSVWFTLEVTPRQFMKKITRKAGDNFPFFYMPRRGMDDIDEKLLKWWEAKNGRKIDTIDWLELKILEAVEKHGVRVVFIDHLHMIYSIERMTRRSNLSFEIGDVANKVKNIALANNLVVFMIAHTKDPQEGVMREPRKEDIRDSGLISRNADSIIGVWRVPNTEDDLAKPQRRIALSEGDNKSKVRVFKNRREGVQGAFFMHHYAHYLSEDPFFGEGSSWK